MTAMAIFLGVLDGFSATVGGIWLTVFGEWSAIGAGLAFAVVGTFFGLVITRSPGVALTGAASRFLEQGYPVRFYSFLLLSNLWDSAVIAVWSVSVFYYFVSSSDQSSLIPFLLWSFGIANAPFQFAAAKEPNQNIGSIIETWSRQIGYVVMMLMVFLQFKWIHVITVFVLILVVGIVAELAVTFQIQSKVERVREDSLTEK
jgi:hypothetical protein